MNPSVDSTNQSVLNERTNSVSVLCQLLSPPQQFHEDDFDYLIDEVLGADNQYPALGAATSLLGADNQYPALGAATSYRFQDKIDSKEDYFPSILEPCPLSLTTPHFEDRPIENAKCNVEPTPIEFMSRALPSVTNYFDLGAAVPVQQSVQERPRKALTSYNLFFQNERRILLQSLPDPKSAGRKKPRNSHGKLGFANMARIISAKWRKLTPQEKAPFDELAKLEKQRYVREMAKWKESQEKEQEKNQHITESDQVNTSFPKGIYACLQQHAQPFYSTHNNAVFNK